MIENCLFLWKFSARSALQPLPFPPKVQLNEAKFRDLKRPCIKFDLLIYFGSQKFLRLRNSVPEEGNFRHDEYSRWPFNREEVDF